MGDEQDKLQQRSLSSQPNPPFEDAPTTSLHQQQQMLQNSSKSNQFDDGMLEGTLIYRMDRSAKSSVLKKNTRLYTVFDMSGAAGGSMEVGGIGSLKCYRFAELSKKDLLSAYSSTKLSSSINTEKTSSERSSQSIEFEQDRTLFLDIPGHLPWTVIDVENDPSAFVIEISTSGFDTYEFIQKSAITADAGVDVREGEEDATDDESVDDVDEDGVFDFWKGDSESEDEEDQETSTESKDRVQHDLARAAAKNKPYIRYTFRTQSKKNEKALWVAAFSKVGRLSEESKKKKTIFGTTVDTAPKNSRKRQSVDPTSLTEMTEKEYRVRPNYNYVHQWMTLSELTAEMKAPSAVIHDTRLSPTVATNSRELGLLRLELLQCLGLPRPKGKDPNAVVYFVCGSYAFTTDVITQCQSPMWLCNMKRACALPIFHGYAVLMVGVFHDDGKGSQSKDTFFGRVEIPVAQLRPNTSYDVTLPLRQSTSVYDRKRLGAVRLRLSLDIYNDKQIILSYLPHRRNKQYTTVACADAKSFRNVALTVHGIHLPDKFSSETLKAALRELTFMQAAMLQLSRQFVRDLISWRQPIFSAFALFGWMHCVYSESIALAPVYGTSFLLLKLVSSYSYCVVSSRHEDFRPMSWEELLFHLTGITTAETSHGKPIQGIRASSFRLLSFSGAKYGDFPGASIAGYASLAVDDSLNTPRQNYDEKLERSNEDVIGDVDLDNDLDLMNADTDALTGQQNKLPQQDLSAKGKGSKSEKGKGKTIEQELEQVEENVQKATKYLFKYNTYLLSGDDEPPFGKKVSIDKGSDATSSIKRDLDKLLGINQYSQWNPIISKVTTQFIPIIRIFSLVLSIQRSMYNVATWQNPVLTFYLTIYLGLLIVMLSLFPWRMAFLIVGFVVLGPQNWALRVFREKQSKRPISQLRKDDERNKALTKKEDEKLSGAQPILPSHAPASKPLREGGNDVGPQHITVPYSALYFNRFYDWPPDAAHSRVVEDVSINGTLCSTKQAVTIRKKLAQAPNENNLAENPSNEEEDPAEDDTSSLEAKPDNPSTDSARSSSGIVTMKSGALNVKAKLSKIQPLGKYKKKKEKSEPFNVGNAEITLLDEVEPANNNAQVEDSNDQEDEVGSQPCLHDEDNTDNKSEKEESQPTSEERAGEKSVSGAACISRDADATTTNEDRRSDLSVKDNYGRSSAMATKLSAITMRSRLVKGMKKKYQQQTDLAEASPAIKEDNDVAESPNTEVADEDRATISDETSGDNLNERGDSLEHALTQDKERLAAEEEGEDLDESGEASDSAAVMKTKFSSGAKTMKSRLSKGVTAKLKKYQHAGLSEATAITFESTQNDAETPSVDEISATNNDEDEHISTELGECDRIAEEEKSGLEPDLTRHEEGSGFNQAGAGKSPQEAPEEKGIESKAEEDTSDPNRMVAYSDELAQGMNNDNYTVDEAASNASDRVDPDAPSNDDVGIRLAAHTRHPSVDSDAAALLQELVAIKLELATSRTENDTYQRLLKDTEAERDMYKDLYDQGQPKSKNKHTKSQGGINLFHKKKSSEQH